MRRTVIALSIALGLATSASAQLSIGFSVPGVSIGINVPVYPQLTRVPGYPVYYAPQLGFNFFFYDGLYWVFQGDNWYASNWYNGPWGMVGPEAVPVYLLRVPVRYYRSPPPYFGGWRRDAPPRWGDHWGNSWQQQRRGWDQWNRNAAPAPAPLPTYQRRYPSDRYPQADEQQRLRSQNYRYQYRDPVVRQHFQAPEPQRSAPPAPPPRAQPQPPPRQDAQRPGPPPQQTQPPRQSPPDRGPQGAGPDRRPNPPGQQASGPRGGPRDQGSSSGQQRQDRPGDRGPDRRP